MKSRVDSEVLEETIAKIEELDREVIEGIVSRIPDDFLADEDLAETLIERRDLVRESLADYLP